MVQEHLPGRRQRNVPQRQRCVRLTTPPAASSGRAPLLRPEPDRGGRCPRPGTRAGTLSVEESLLAVSGSGLGAATYYVATYGPRQLRPPKCHS